MPKEKARIKNQYIVSGIESRKKEKEKKD